MSSSDFVFLIICACHNFIPIKEVYINCLAKYVVGLMEMYLTVLMGDFQNSSV